MSLRIGGLASGMDIDSIIEKMMSARKLSTNKLFQQKQTIQWQRESYRDMNTKIYDFRNNKISSYRLEGGWLQKTVKLTGNQSAVTAKAAGNALPSTLTVQVNQLATAATNQSSVDIRSMVPDKDQESFDPSKSMKQQLSTFVAGTFSINGKSLTVSDNDSLNDIINKINKETDVTAFYDASTGKVAFSAKETGLVNGEHGNSAYIQFSGDFLTQTLKVTGPGTAAQNANVTVNGLEMNPTSNTLEINGVTITLQEAGGAATTLTVTNDTDAVLEKVKSFVNDYNEFLSSIQDKVNESRYRGFHPLTDEQKKEMSEREVELWEKKAKSGMLRNDPILNSLVMNLRSMMYEQVDTGSSKYKSLQSIGITSGAYDEKGKLYINENKLRQAIEEDPEAIMKLFAGSGTDSQTGIAKKMYDELQVAMDKITQKAGHPSYTESQSRDESFIGRQLYELNKRIDLENARMANLEQLYYRQFTAMESAINRYNAQSMYLMNAFGGGV